jgi:hypothetical protein
MTQPTTPPIERRWLLAGATFGAAVWLVVLALSFQSLAAYGRESLGLSGPWSLALPVSLDLAAFTVMAFSLHSTSQGYGAGGARLSLWALIAGSAAVNGAHGAQTSTAAALVFAAWPLIAGVLADLALQLVLRDSLQNRNAVAPPLPRYRALRYLLSPITTASALRAAVLNGVSGHDEAIAASGSRRRILARHDDDGGLRQLPAGQLSELPEGAADIAARFRADAISQAEAMRWAFASIGDYDARRARELLSRLGIEVQPGYAYELGKAERGKATELPARPALAAASTNGEHGARVS